MKIQDKIKIKLWIKRFTYEDLIMIKAFIDNEKQERDKNIKKIKKSAR